MRFLFFIWMTVFLSGCNSSSSKKYPGQAIDDTARMDPLPLQLPKIEPIKGTAVDIPATIKLKGKVQEVWKWTDNSGENILIITRVTPYNDPEYDKSDEVPASSELYAFQYVKKDSGYQQIWMLTDAEKKCYFDISCDFIKDAISVTDLDQDGIAETTVQYKLACRSDVSPALMKLVMHEGQTKYVLRGVMWYGSPEEKFIVTENDANLETLPGYKKTDDEYYKTWGRYESEKEFATAPPEFLKHARKQWLKFAKESSE
jgi:hypothetical protein